MEGNSEVVGEGPAGLGWSIDWLPDGRLLVTGERLTRREPDGSMVPHVDLSSLGVAGFNEIVVDGRGNIYVNGGADFEPGAGEAPGIVVLGSALIVAGVGVLLHSFARFVNEGRGTPAPIAPPERLVVGGLYRHVRNPMYVAVGATIVGQALLLGPPWLFAYAGAFWLVVAGFVRGYEEPTLNAQYGEEYAAYRRSVPAWWPRLRPWSPPPRR